MLLLTSFVLFANIVHSYLIDTQSILSAYYIIELLFKSVKKKQNEICMYTIFINTKLHFLVLFVYRVDLNYSLWSLVSTWRTSYSISCKMSQFYLRTTLFYLHFWNVSLLNITYLVDFFSMCTLNMSSTLSSLCCIRREVNRYLIGIPL